MGSGQSNGRPEEPGTRRAGQAPAGPPSSMANRIMASNGQVAAPVSMDTPRGNAAEQPSPRKGKDVKADRHVAIAVADPRIVMYKGQKGGLLDKLKGVTSRNNSFMSTVSAVVRAASHANAPGSRAGSDRSAGSHTSRRAKRDEYDVDSGDEDLQGFIYEDESTSEDEREDYVNAFGRRRKVPKADDYSDYEGAGARALTAGGRKPPKSAAMRRGARRTSDEEDDDDGDDEFDPEEERIRQLRQKKKQEERERAKAVAHATLAVANATMAVATMKVGAGARKANGGDGGLGPPAASGPSVSRSVVIVENVPGREDYDGGRERQQSPRHVRISPQPPPEPPVRGGSGNLRRGAAAAAAAASSSYGSGAVGGSGGGNGGGMLGIGPGPTASGPSVNYGASASSQYWQALRASHTDAFSNDALAGREPSRLEQLATLQRQRLERQERQERQRVADEGGGVRWREDAQASQAGDGRSGGQERGEQQERSVRWGRQGLDSEDQPSSRATISEWRHERSSSSNTTITTTTTSTVATSSSRQLLPNRDSAPSAAGPPGAPAPLTAPLRAPPQQRDSDVPADFDVDEVLNSFASPGAPRQNGDGWRGPQAPTGPPSAPPADGYTSSGKRSIRAVQSDFTSMRASEASDDIVDLASRMLSMPMSAPRPVQPATGGGPSLGGAGSTQAASSVSRFARLGANLMTPAPGGAAAAAESAGAGSSSAAAWPGGGNAGPSAFAQRVSGAGGGLTPSLGGMAVRAASPSQSPARLPRGNASNDGSYIHTAASAPVGEAAAYRRTALLSGPEHNSSTGGAIESVALPAIRPPSNSGHRASDSGSLASGVSQELAARSSGGGSSVAHPHARTRFGATQHQQFQQQSVQEAAGMRASAPLPSSQRDYDSDSAVLRNGAGGMRGSWNGAAGVPNGAAGSGGGGPAGLAPGVGTSRSRLGAF